MPDISDYGLKNDGFHSMSFKQAQELIIDKLRKGDNQLDLTDNSTIASIFNSIAKVMENNNQTEHAVADQANVLYATGTSLDGLAMQEGLIRYPATISWCYLSIKGDIGTDIPVSTTAVNKQGDIFVNTEQTTIDANNNCSSATIKIGTVESEQDYKITIQTTNIPNHTLTYHSGQDATEDEILDGLYLALNQDVIFTQLTNIVKNNLNKTLTITSKTEPLNTFTLLLNDFLFFSKATISVPFYAIDTGPNSVVANSLSLKENITGVDSATNLADGVTGRNIETDSELRIRIIQNSTNEKMTLTAIENALKDQNVIKGITYARVINTKIGEQEFIGRTYDVIAIEAIVVGGNDNEVAQVIYDNKSVASYTTGNTVGIANDTNGLPARIYFSRPVSKYIWVKITLTEESAGSLPDNYEDLTKQSVMGYASSLSIGDDVNIVYLRNAVVNNLSGLSNIEVLLASTDTPSGTPEYSPTSIIIDERAIAVFSELRIDVSKSNI